MQRKTLLAALIALLNGTAYQAHAYSVTVVASRPVEQQVVPRMEAIKGVLFHSASEPKEIINKYAKEGYSYVGFIPTLIDAHGGFRRIDLIFEK